MKPRDPSNMGLLRAPAPRTASETRRARELLAELTAAADGFAARAAALTRTRDTNAAAALARDAYGLERLAIRARLALELELLTDAKP